jgi:hypothetical protein
VASSRSFDELIVEGEGVSLEGWDFSWFEGRATEERPPWGYAQLLAKRLVGATAVCDSETGGGEVFAWALERARNLPSTLAATEAWAPNAEVARRRLGPFGVNVAHERWSEAGAATRV